ncbi:MAG TPA: elongation factor P--(R)-beta-lysine ligase [Gammaproteobacteria bacterium]|nr:elongation factor P--(R)-beta-lysine ligase [Gammaproteobacteria bacterium]
MADTRSSWKPSASLANLRLRSRIIAAIRNFFADRGVLEVETPLLCKTTATDPHIASFRVLEQSSAPISDAFASKHTADFPYQYLQTSPEFAMKRLLASGSGSIYQICKAFRLEEHGRYHHSEFTMLEWYRIGFDHHQLMDEIDLLLQTVADTESADRLTYAEIFQNFLSIDPHISTTHELQNCAQQNGIEHIENPDPENKDFWLYLLLSHCIEPHLGGKRPVFILDFPAQQAALAKIRPSNPPVAERFELYWKGIELANGYHELTDAKEQERRFKADNKKRRQLNLPEIPEDQQLLAALSKGMPDCAGVALGIDRLVMLAAHLDTIDKVISFSSSPFAVDLG